MSQSRKIGEYRGNKGRYEDNGLLFYIKVIAKAVIFLVGFGGREKESES